ncbi:MAG: V-type ATP synthase subunit I [Clostridiales bacterium]|nr:V-type ATP synthase subunit I [Clostridiales bacterium]
MAVLQMQRMNLVAMKQNRKSILERLQEIGGIEIDVKAEEFEGTVCQDTSTPHATFEKRSATADQALEILDKFVPEKSSLLSSLAGKPLIERSELKKTVENQSEYMRQANQIVNLDKQITEATATIQKLENQAEALVPWEKMDIPMSTEGTAKTALYFGTMPELVSEEAVLTALKTHEPAVDQADVEILSTDKDTTYLSVLCLRRDAAAAEEALREMGFARPTWFVSRTPAEEQEVIRKEIEAHQKEIEGYIAELSKFGPARGDLQMVSDYYRMRAGKYEVLGTLPQTENTFAVSGYIPAYLAKELSKELETEYGAVVELEEIAEDEKPPVLLKNNPFSNSVDGVLASYGLPGKGEIDPTVIMSIFYIVMFGIMLSDAGYGALMVIFCGIALAKFPRMGEGLRKSLKMFFFCGISTVVWGILFGGFFGDVIQVVSREFFGHEVAFNAVWFAPIDDPMRLLIYALIIGIIHLFLGLAIHGYTLLKHGDGMGFFSEVVGWFAFLVGLLLLLIPSSIFESMAQTTIDFGPALTYLSYILTIVGALILLLFAGRRKKKKVGMRLLLGVYEIYGITSWLSDWLSYSRLLALGLATGAIAQVVNMIGTMFGSGVLKLAIFIVVFIIGHVLNMAINLLGAYVHSNRLEYVEFFQKFYNGSGEPFKPFQTETRYVDFARSK